MVSIVLYELSNYSPSGNAEALMHDGALYLLKFLPLGCSGFLGLPGVMPVVLEFLFR